MTKDPACLQNMLDIIDRIEIATAAGKNAFFESVIHQDAVLRNLHTLSETTQRLSVGLKESHPEIDWAAFMQDVPDLNAKVTKLLDSPS